MVQSSECQQSECAFSGLQCVNAFYAPGEDKCTTNFVTCSSGILSEPVEVGYRRACLNGQAVLMQDCEEVVDNCEKRPAKLFREQVLGVEECEKALREAVELLRQANPAVKVILTVSPIRYAKYGYPESARSKAVLLLAAHQVAERYPGAVAYFPAYEIMNDELRDYRFYRPDMLHPSEQAVDYIHERFSDAYFSERAATYVKEWRRLRAALRHRPFNPDSDAYQAFKRQTQEQVKAFAQRYPTFPDNPMEEAV